MKTEHIYRFTFENRPPSTMVQLDQLDQQAVWYSSVRANESNDSGERTSRVGRTGWVIPCSTGFLVGRTRAHSGEPSSLFGRAEQPSRANRTPHSGELSTLFGRAEHPVRANQKPPFERTEPCSGESNESSESVGRIT